MLLIGFGFPFRSSIQCPNKFARSSIAISLYHTWAEKKDVIFILFSFFHFLKLPFDM